MFATLSLYRVKNIKKST